MVLAALTRVPKIAKGIASLGEIGSRLENLPVLKKIFKTDPKHGEFVLRTSVDRLTNTPLRGKGTVLRGINRELEATDIINTADYESATKDLDIATKIQNKITPVMENMTPQQARTSSAQLIKRAEWAVKPKPYEKFKEQRHKIHMKKIGEAQETPITKESLKFITKEFATPQDPVNPSEAFKKFRSENKSQLFGKYRDKILADKRIPLKTKNNFKNFMAKRLIGQEGKGFSKELKESNLQDIKRVLARDNFNKIKGDSPAHTQELRTKNFIKAILETRGDPKDKRFHDVIQVIEDYNKRFGTNILPLSKVREAWDIERGFHKGGESALIDKTLRKNYENLDRNDLFLMKHHLRGVKDKLGRDRWMEYVKRVEKTPGTLLATLTRRYPDFSKKWDTRTQVSQKYSKGIKYLRNDLGRILGIDPKVMDVENVLPLGYGVHASHMPYKGKGVRSTADPKTWNLSLGFSNLYKERNKIDKRLYNAIVSGDPEQYYITYNKRNTKRSGLFYKKDPERKKWSFETDLNNLRKLREVIKVEGETLGRQMNWPALQRWMKKIGLAKARKEKNLEMIEYFESEGFNTPITYEGISYNKGGLINSDLSDTIPPTRGPMPEGLPLLDPQESINRQKFAIGGFARLFGALSKAPKAVARVGDMVKSVGKAEKATDIAVGQAVEDKPAMFLSTVNAIEDMPEVNMGAQQWLGTIKNKPGVSATELDEFGLEALLTNIAKADPKRKLSKTELLETYNREMPKIDMDIAMAEPVSRGANDITKMLTAVRESRGHRPELENLKVLSNDPRLLTALHQPPQDATGMKIRENIINTMRGTNKAVGTGEDADMVPLLKEGYGGQQVELHKGQHFKEMWESAFPRIYHGTNDIVKRDHMNVLKNLVPAEDVTRLAVAKNIPEEEAFKQLYQALNIFDRQVMTGDVPIPFWTKKMLYRLGDMSEGRGFFFKSKRTPAHEGTQFIPGGSGYGELKFYFNFDTGAVRAQEGTYKAGHFSGEVFKGNAGNSPFGWGRFSERIDESGRKILLMEEIQSDLHQQVAQKGYKYAPRLDKGDVLAEMGDFAAQLAKKEQTLESTRLRKDNILQLSRVERESPENVAELKNIETALKKLVKDIKKLEKKVQKQEELTGKSGKVHPDAPFKKSENYAKVILQGLMKMASDKGYDGIGLSTGKMKKAHGNIPKGGDKWYDEIGVSAMKRIAKKSGFKFKDTTIVDGNGYTWEKIPLIEMRDINTGQRIPGESTIPVYKKGGIVNKKMVKK